MVTLMMSVYAGIIMLQVKSLEPNMGLSNEVAVSS